MRSVYIDITEFIRNPVRTGIQRIVREVLKCWPSTLPFVPVIFDSGRKVLRSVAREAVDLAIKYASEDDYSLEEAIHEIRFLDNSVRNYDINLTKDERILIPELFFDEDRIRLYRTAISNGVFASFIVPDFLVWLRTETFPNGTATYPMMPYLQLLIECPRRAFISAAVKRTFEQRILRRETGGSGIALDLGADGLNIPKQKFRIDRRDLLFLGTLDGRKGQDVVYEAFCAREQPCNLTLIFVGKVPHDYAPCLQRLLDNRRADVKLITDATDDHVAAYFNRVRASVYISAAEGYGLPPMESLYAGVPVIVNRDLPAFEGKPADGQIRTGGDPAAIRHAIERVADDCVARELWAGAAGYPSVTWKSVAQTVADWVIA
jgi:glycosyltransferase involved in cell wall biosynthesis